MTPGARTAAFGAVLAVLVTLADTGSLPLGVLVSRNLLWGDKLGHLVLFGTLAWLLDRSWQAPWGSLTILILAGIEELSQVFFPLRSVDPWDLVADLAGVWIAVLSRSVSALPRFPGGGVRGKERARSFLRESLDPRRPQTPAPR